MCYSETTTTTPFPLFNPATHALILHSALTHGLNTAEGNVAQLRLSQTNLLNLWYLVRQHPDALSSLWTSLKENLL